VQASTNTWRACRRQITLCVGEFLFVGTERDEYQTLVRAFHKEISPHIDQEMAKRVLDTDWLQALETKPAPQK
jgi:hypothetical protein